MLEFYKHITSSTIETLIFIAFMFGLLLWIISLFRSIFTVYRQEIIEKNIIFNTELFKQFNFQLKNKNQDDETSGEL